MKIDPMRLAESGAHATLLLGTVVLPSAWRTLDGPLATVLAAVAAVLTAGCYALHAVTFDCFRLTGQRSRRNLSCTPGEE